MDNPHTPTTPHRRLHPLIATAAAGVIVASLAATAAITGLFPKASSSDAQDNQTQAAAVTSQSQGVVDSAAPANLTANGQVSQPAQQAAAPQEQPQTMSPQPAAAAPATPAPPAQQAAQAQYAQQPSQPQYAQQPSQPQYAQQQPQPAPAYCATCGTVESIVTVKKEGHGTGVGAVGGAVAGGLVGNMFGHGTGRAAMTVLGAVGGGFAGNSVEKHLRSETDYQVRVRMENGHTRYFTYRAAPPFQQGERVRVENGTLVAG
ncbi:outer membrane lipoprotein [Trinickia mobilis]|uniref:glycine zipper 2TM domain-containing protein n=1 Tax=Trinickia mobilis TaxID=2816356 RepID=UPI001A8F5DAB|nr:glycine zipper 2TM domain-containing protein [Trinickia mobilis]